MTVIAQRVVRERVPNARYAMNVSILDGLGGNEVFFKFAQDVTKDDDKPLLYSRMKEA